MIAASLCLACATPSAQKGTTATAPATATEGEVATEADTATKGGTNGEDRYKELYARYQKMGESLEDLQAKVWNVSDKNLQSTLQVDLDVAKAQMSEAEGLLVDTNAVIAESKSSGDQASATKAKDLLAEAEQLLKDAEQSAKDVRTML